MGATADARGLKRVCVGCGTRYYDFNKRPIKCPSCAAEFSGEIKLKTRRGRGAAVAEVVAEAKRPAVNDEAIEQVEQDENLVSLDDVAKEEDVGDEEEIEGGDIESLESLEDDEDLKEDLEVEIEKE